MRHYMRAVDAELLYLAPGPFVNRRFVSPGKEVNTGTYRPYPVKIRDGRQCRERFNLDEHGFVLADHTSSVRDFLDKKEVESVYPDEAAAVVQNLTGADKVVLRCWMVRTSGEIEPRETRVEGYRHQAGVQPPAGEVHVDYAPDTALRLARRTYAQTFPGEPSFKRFMLTSLWRTFSPPPQDWPLAVCDGRSVGADEGTPNTLVVVDEIPDYETMVGDWPPDKLGPSATIFQHNPDHRWWYFSGMNRDEVLLLKFHDSNRRTAWRVPHTAFFDFSATGANERRSIEVRSAAYFL